MCGISGQVIFSEEGGEVSGIEKSVRALQHRGPDHCASLSFTSAHLGHARLSIIDTSVASHQPFTDITGKFHLVFNGEIFNYRELKEELTNSGVRFKSNGDAEVLLELYKKTGAESLNKLNGFFSFGIYNSDDKTLFLARDRFGVKPLYYFSDDKSFCFSSEIRALQAFGLALKPDFDSLFHYLQLNYIPGPHTIFREIKSLAPGHCCVVQNGKISFSQYYDLEAQVQAEKNKKTIDPLATLRSLLENSVRDRLVADVPVGCFLSGGIDSTIIAGLASLQTKKLSTFCLGFTGNKWFDESPYAEAAAEQFGTDHHTFMLSNDDLFSELYNFLDSLDEPFADSSALNVYILSKKTKQYVKTVLSGDGADEIFGGYNKHRAEWLIGNSSRHRILAGGGSFFSFLFPKSRNSGFANKMRQLEKFSAVMNLPAKERYWKMAGVASEDEAQALVMDYKTAESNKRKEQLLRSIEPGSGLEKFLLTDVKLVLEGDMLVKVDRMSMAHGLEVRNPFLDHRLVAWGLALGIEQKINAHEGKLVLKRAFADLIPAGLLVRKKHGFEVPLHKWMNNELKSDIDTHYLGDDFIREQKIFSLAEIQKLKRQVFSSNPGDSAARVWAIFVFNYWYKKNRNYFS
jgi:asparagine synthase (glutamine-hydrolysing)